MTFRTTPKLLKLKFVVFLWFLSLLIAACSDCRKMLYEQTELENEDTVDQTVEVCRQDNRSQLKKVSVAAGKSSTVLWDSHQIFDNLSETIVCNKPKNEKIKIHILLSAEAQKSFRLCTDSTENYSFVAASQGCPNQTQEVSEACSTP